MLCTHASIMCVLNMYTRYLPGQLLWWGTIATLVPKLSFVAMTSKNCPEASCIDAADSVLEGCPGVQGALANQPASTCNWPSDMAHQAVTADGVQDGSMEDDTVPSNPPGDALRSAGLPHQAGQGPQAQLLHQAGMGAVNRQRHASPSGGLAAPLGVFLDAVSCFTCTSLDCRWMFAVSICKESVCALHFC
jgi:hypothetical protein